MCAHEADPVSNPKIHKVPGPYDLMAPTLRALRDLGGSASIQELVSKIIDNEAYPESIQNQIHGKGPKTELEYNCGWARTHLKRTGLISNSDRKSGIWFLLETGGGTNPAHITEIIDQARKMATEKSLKIKGPAPEKCSHEDLSSDNEDWKQTLLSTILKMDPSAFERLCLLILRESGFSELTVTGKKGDGGIDGVGILRINLLSFHVSFQCKRYKESVGPEHIRAFRGAINGRKEKGIFITTGHYTHAARQESVRDGAHPIDLIDGEDLCDLLKEMKLGVSTELVETVRVDDQWFERV